MDARSANLVETLSRLSLFADLPPRSRRVAHTFNEGSSRKGSA